MKILLNEKGIFLSRTDGKISFYFAEMPKQNLRKIVKVILEFEPAEDADERIRKAFGIIFSGIRLRTEKKLLTKIQDDIK